MLRAQLAQAALAATSFVAPPAVAFGLTSGDPGSFDIPGALAAAAAAAPCPVDPRDLAAIQSKESPSAMVHPDGTTSNPDGSPVRGDGGRSLGPFQFNLDGGAWSVYGAGDPDNYSDAASATARMLCANNYHLDRMAAIARHNGSGPAARAYAEDVAARASELPPLDAAPPAAPVVPAPPSPTTTGKPGCPDGNQDRYAIGAVVDRAWCNIVVTPWLALSKGKNHEQWVAADRWLFGPDKVVSPPPPPPAPPGAVTPAPPGTAPVNGFVCPVATSPVVGDGWGASRGGGTRQHEGVDLFGPWGSSAVAPFSGTIVGANSDEASGGNGGRSVTIQRDDGTEVWMAHLESVDVSVGQTVSAGEHVATVGNTGNARGGDAHIHAQYYPGGDGPMPADDTLGAACGGVV